MKRNTWIYNAVILPIIVLAFLLIFMSAFDLNPFLRIMVERDYDKNTEIFEDFVLNYNDEEIVVTKEDYDKTSRTLEKLFEKMDYEFIRVTQDYVFFCKGYDGMSGIGVMYLTNENYIVSPKEKFVKELDERWVIFSEDYL